MYDALVLRSNLRSFRKNSGPIDVSVYIMKPQRCLGGRAEPYDDTGNPLESVCGRLVKALFWDDDISAATEGRTKEEARIVKSITDVKTRIDC